MYVAPLPYGGGYPYPGYPVVQGPIGDYLNGQANVINSFGNYLSQYQQGRIQNQQAEREVMKTRQMVKDQMAYDEATRPRSQDIKDQQRIRDLRTARNDPPLSDIWSATALNTLLKDVQDAQAKAGIRGPQVPLDPEVVKHINLSARPSASTPAMLRDGGRLKWPLVLQDPRFAPEKQKISELMPQAVKEAQMGEPQFATFTGLRDATTAMSKRIDANAQELSLPDIISAQRFVQEINDSVNLLKEPNAANYFNGKWEARGNTVAELVDFMSGNGLRFAPAGDQDQQFYTALYQSLLTYDSGVMQIANRYTRR
jgi:hypothetical protein